MQARLSAQRGTGVLPFFSSPKIHMVHRTLISLASACSVFSIPALVLAANIQVTTTSGVVNTSDGLCSLAEAVTSANTQSNYGGCVRQSTSSSTESITLGAGVYTTSAALTATRTMTVQGMGSGSTTLRFSGDRGLVANPSNSTQQLFLSGLRVTPSHSGFSICVLAQSGRVALWDADLDGCSAGLLAYSGTETRSWYSKFRNGGFGALVSSGDAWLSYSEFTGNRDAGLYVSGTSSEALIYGGLVSDNEHSGLVVTYGAIATLLSVDVENNRDGGAGGGGLRVQHGAQVEIHDSTIASNTSTFGGGGLYSSYSNVEIFDSLIESNVCSGSACDGGGILCEGAGAPTGDVAVSPGVMLTDSNVTDNVTFGRGGGVAVTVQTGTNMTLFRSSLAHNAASSHGGGLYSTGQEDVIASTISGNYSGGRGGGMYHEGAGELHVYESTIAHNHGSEGGGLYVHSAGNPSQLSNIFANNTAYSGNHDLRVPPGPGISWGARMVVTDTNQLNTSQFGTLYHDDPLLSPLTMVGGHLVHLLGAGSSALNRGLDHSYAPGHLDQLGVERPVNGLLDLGAVEYVP